MGECLHSSTGILTYRAEVTGVNENQKNEKMQKVKKTHLAFSSVL